MIQIGHTPDPDDAFMFYYLVEKCGKGSGVELVLEDIESLNRKVIMRAIDCSAVSFYTYFKVAHNYDLLSVGACFGLKYGPIMVRKKVISGNPQDAVAIPGEHTTSFLLLKIYNPNNVTLSFPFEEIPNLVIDEKIKYGLLIHEMQETYHKFGLEKVVDFGEYWFNLTKLPLPLGCIVIRKGLPYSTKAAIKKLIEESLKYSLEHKEEVLEYAMKFARFADKKDTENFIGKYVKDFSLNISDSYKKSIDALCEMAYFRKLINSKIKITII